MDGKELRRLRERAGVTQEELARRAGVASISISRIERGIQSPSARTEEALLRALGAPEPPTLSGRAAKDLKRLLDGGSLGASGRRFLERLVDWFLARV